MRYSDLLTQLQRLTKQQLDMDVTIADDTGEIMAACDFVIPADLEGVSEAEREALLADEILGGALDEDHPYITTF